MASYRLVEAHDADMLPAQSDCTVLGMDKEQPLGEEGDLPWRGAPNISQRSTARAVDTAPPNGALRTFLLRGQVAG